MTVGELSNAVKPDHDFGLHVRGRSNDGTLWDVLEGGDEDLLTVRLSVDATTETVWQLVCDRIDDARSLDRQLQRIS